MLIASLLIVGTIGILRRYIPLSSAPLAFFRGLIGGLSLLAFMVLRGKTHWQRMAGKTLMLLILNGAFLGINWIFLFEAFNYTTISKATLCYYMQPTIVLLLSPILFRERLTLLKLLSAAAALFGMVLVSGVMEAGTSSSGDGKGVIFGLAAAVFYSLVVILNKKIVGADPYQKTVVQLISAAVVLLPYLVLTNGFGLAAFDWQLVLMLLVIGVVYTGVVYALYFGSMSGLRAQTISALSYIDPIVAMIVSAVVLGEGMSAGGLIGAAMILASAAIAELTPRRKDKTNLRERHETQSQDHRH